MKMKINEMERWHKLGYAQGVADSKREPLSDEELKNLYDRHAFAMESDEYMWGFRDAEKAHGIGGGEE
jgi:hypothetical protein